MITRTEIEALGWELDDELTTASTKYRIGDVKMMYNNENDRTRIAKPPYDDPILECKIHTQKELRGEMSWLGIPVKHTENE